MGGMWGKQGGEGGGGGDVGRRVGGTRGRGDGGVDNMLAGDGAGGEIGGGDKDVCKRERLTSGACRSLVPDVTLPSEGRRADVLRPSDPDGSDCLRDWSGSALERLTRSNRAKSLGHGFEQQHFTSLYPGGHRAQSRGL